MTPANKRVVVVLGMHRSGTSTLTRALNVVGVELGDHLLAPMEGSNNKGFFEDIDLFELNIHMLQALGSVWHGLPPIEASDVESLCRKGYFLTAVNLLRQKMAEVSIFGFKDPRIPRLLPFWDRVFAHCGFDVNYVLAIRNPLSVVQSLTKRDGFTPEKSYMLWLGHVLPSLFYSQGHNRVLIDYDRFLDAPQQHLELIAMRLGLGLSHEALQLYLTDFLDESLRHSVYNVNDLAIDQACPQFVQELYATLLEITNDNQLLENPAFHACTVLWCDELNRMKLNLRWEENLLGQIAELVQGRSYLETQLHELTGREQTVVLQLQEMQQNYERHNSEQTEREQTLKLQLTEVQQHLEACLAEQNVRENVFSEQLQAMQRLHDSQVDEQRLQFTEREQLLHGQLSQVQQRLESYLIGQVEREKADSLQRQEIHQAYELQKNDLIRQYAERERIAFLSLDQARQQFEAQVLSLTEREKAYVLELQETHQAHELKMAEQSRLQYECEQVLQAQLQTQLQTQQDELAKLAEYGKAKDAEQEQLILRLQHQIKAMRKNYFWRLMSALHLLGGNDLGQENSRNLLPLKKQSVGLAGLLSYDGESFINNAYVTLLGRVPDPEGMNYYYNRLQSGVSKVEILAQLLKGPEGKLRRVNVVGLNKAVRYQKYFKIPILGQWLKFFDNKRMGKSQH